MMIIYIKLNLIEMKKNTKPMTVIMIVNVLEVTVQDHYKERRK